MNPPPSPPSLLPAATLRFTRPQQLDHLVAAKLADLRRRVPAAAVHVDVMERAMEAAHRGHVLALTAYPLD